MPVPLVRRTDYDASALRLLARSSCDADQTRRLLALASIYEGSARFEAARQASVTPQIVRDWVVRFNSDGPDGLVDRKAPGRMPKLNAEQLRALLVRVEAGPMPAVDGLVRWRIVDLVQWVFEEFRISLSAQTMNRVLREAGYRKLSARPRHQGQDPEAIATSKKTPHRAGGNPGSAQTRHAHRNMVAGRSLCRPEEHHHPSLGQTRHKAVGSQGPEDKVSLSVRSDLPPRGQGCRSRHAALRHRRHEPPPHRDLPGCGPGRPRSAAARPGRMAHHQEPRRSHKHRPVAAAPQMSGTQSAGERLAVHPRKLALQPNLRQLRRHPRPLLRRLEQPRRPAMAHHVNRTP